MPKTAKRKSIPARLLTMVISSDVDLVPRLLEVRLESMRVVEFEAVGSGCC